MAQRQRSRLQSLDQQLNDITDFSRQPNDPYIGNNASNAQMRFIQSLKLDKNIKDNTLLVTFIRYLQDQIIELGNKPLFDAKGTTDITASSEQALITTLVKQEVQTQPGMARLQSLLEMIMVWIKFNTNGFFIL